jgi:hypothetical protein
MLLLNAPFVPATSLQGEVPIGGSTVVPVKLAGFISSETSVAGDAVRFRVASDVIAGGAVVIARGSPATGTVVDAASYKHPTAWSGSTPGRVQFSIDTTTAVDGQTIRLRLLRSAPRGVAGGALLQGPTRLEWIHEAIAFEARVEGEYVVKGRMPRVAHTRGSALRR